MSPRAGCPPCRRGRGMRLRLPACTMKPRSHLPAHNLVKSWWRSEGGAGHACRWAGRSGGPAVGAIGEDGSVRTAVGSRPLGVAEVVDRLAGVPGREDRLRHLEVLPARPARHADWPEWAAP